ncbi:hypothetical protein [Plantactinospora endophytica]|uniref:hypothetical protein n=1 Tax=Plantactinospora endophytica TaxID=673535 RepID=UPI00194572AD|nr:hypothetical protein [Plantactinospora endophytica]
MRFVTALVLMGLLLGAGAARAGLPGPAVAGSDPRPAAARSTVQDPRADLAEVPVTAPALRTGPDPTADERSRAVDWPVDAIDKRSGAVERPLDANDERSRAVDGTAGAADEPPAVVVQRPSVVLEESAATDDRPEPVGSVPPTVLVRADLFGGEPDRPVVGSMAGAWPAGNAYARVVGPRAPPLG